MRIIFQAMRFETVLIAMSSPITSSSATLESSFGVFIGGCLLPEKTWFCPSRDPLDKKWSSGPPFLKIIFAARSKAGEKQIQP